MHLAAKYALRHLSEQLLDLPNSNHACQLCNADGRTPSQLAAFKGHNDLASRLSLRHSPQNVSGHRHYTSVLIL